MSCLKLKYEKNQEEVLKRLNEILKQSDLASLTRKTVRKQLEMELGVNLSSPEWRDTLKNAINDFLEQRQNEEQNQNEDNNSEHGSSDENILPKEDKASEVSKYDEVDSRAVKKKKMNDSNIQATKRDKTKPRNKPKFDEEEEEEEEGQEQLPEHDDEERAGNQKPLLQYNKEDDSYSMTVIFFYQISQGNFIFCKSKKGGTMNIIRHREGGLEHNKTKSCQQEVNEGKAYVGLREFYAKDGVNLPTKRSQFGYGTMEGLLYFNASN
ncbi:hypothetical protein RFI_23240 [Reticulomyxa filosa]|uniref:DEK-C domain-containing protein n=1 Tax=Reticulomyxa filosa TaxID=46433 RepID=X6MJT4_RETFI|nr:hypothetical protein RFI_23240 [Reticulomyxa filosa]|eukprot:ETO14129.1 hypothetical protein RFI_23240 [Reticulomyxa filosa]